MPFLLYARKGDPTLARDLRALQKMQLVVKEQGGLRARREAILAFLPAHVPPQT